MPVQLFGGLQVEVITFVVLLELYQNQVFFSGIIKNIQLAVFDRYAFFVAVSPAFMIIPFFKITLIRVKISLRIVLAITVMVQAFPVAYPVIQHRSHFPALLLPLFLRQPVHLLRDDNRGIDVRTDILIDVGKVRVANHNAAVAGQRRAVIGIGGCAVYPDTAAAPLP